MKSGVFVLAAVFILVLSTGFVNLIAQGSGGSESGDAVLLSKSSDNINLGDTWGVFTGTIDGDDLNVLADGTYVAYDSGEFDYEQKISIGSPTLTHFRDSDYEDLVNLSDRTPVLGFKISSGNHIMNYTLDFVQDAESSITSGDLDDFEGSVLHLLGKTYYVFDAKSGDSSGTKGESGCGDFKFTRPGENSIMPNGEGDLDSSYTEYDNYTVDNSISERGLGSHWISERNPDIHNLVFNLGAEKCVDKIKVGLLAQMFNRLNLHTWDGEKWVEKFNNWELRGNAYEENSFSKTKTQYIKLAFEYVGPDYRPEKEGNYGYKTLSDVQFNIAEPSEGTSDHVGKLTLLDNGITNSVKEGSSTTVNVEDKSYTVNIISIYNDDDNGEVVFDINGERAPSSGKLNVGDSFRLNDGSYIGVRDIAGKSGGASFSIGSGKLELTHGNDIKLNDDTINGIKAYMPKGTSTSSDEKLDKIVIEWITDEEVFLTEDLNLEMPGGFGNIKFTMDLVRNDEERITIQPDGDNSLEMTVPIKDGTVSFNLLYGSNGEFTGLGKASDERLATSSNSLLTFHDKDSDGNDYHSWFVASYNTASESESYLLRAKVNTDVTVGRNLTTVDKNVDGSWVEVCKDKNVSAFCDIGKVSMTVEDIEYALGGEEYVTFRAGSGVSFNKLFTKNGLTVYLPDENQVWGNTYDLLLAEKDKDGELEKNQFGVELNSMTGGDKFQAGPVFQGDLKLSYLEKGDSGIYESYIRGDVATRALHYTKPDEDYVEIYYPAKPWSFETSKGIVLSLLPPETYAEVYLTGSVVEDSVVCTDSDGGLDYYVKGELASNKPSWEEGDYDKCGIEVNEGNYEHISSCSGEDCYLIELYCLGSEPTRDFYNCPNGCKDGACIKGGDVIPTIDVELSEGWNLVPFKDLLTDPLEDISEKEYRGLFLDNNIRAAFVFNPLYQKYAKLHKLFSNRDVTNSILDFIGWEHRYMQLNKQSLFHASYWVYSFSDQTISIPVENDYIPELEGTELYSGWNFLTISEDMMGMSMNEWTGDCRVVKAAIWSSERQGWDIGEANDFNQKFDGSVLGKGLVLNVVGNCELGDNIAPPPLPPEGTCTDSDGGVNLIEKGEICIDDRCFSDYCSKTNKLWEGYCTEDGAGWREAWGDCKDGKLVFDSNEYLIVDNIGNNFIGRVDTEKEICSELMENSHDVPNIDLGYECDGHFANYANKDYRDFMAFVFVRDDEFREDEVVALKENLVKAYEKLFEGHNENIKFEVNKASFEKNYIYEISLSADDEFFLPMYAWFSENKVIFITNDDGPNENDKQTLGEIAKPYLIKYPSGLTG